MVEAEKKKEVVRPNLKALRGDAARRGIRPSLRQRRLRLLKPGGGAVVNLSSGGGGGGGGGGGEDFTDAALDTAGAEQRAAYEAAVVAHEEEEVRTVRSTVPRGVYIHRKVGEMEEME